MSSSSWGGGHVSTRTHRLYFCILLAALCLVSICLQGCVKTLKEVCKDKEWLPVQNGATKWGCDTRQGDAVTSAECELLTLKCDEGYAMGNFSNLSYEFLFERSKSSHEKTVCVVKFTFSGNMCAKCADPNSVPLLGGSVSITFYNKTTAKMMDQMHKHKIEDLYCNEGFQRSPSWKDIIGRSRIQVRSRVGNDAAFGDDVHQLEAVEMEGKCIVGVHVPPGENVCIPDGASSFDQEKVTPHSMVNEPIIPRATTNHSFVTLRYAIDVPDGIDVLVQTLSSNSFWHAIHFGLAYYVGIHFKEIDPQIIT